MLQALTKFLSDLAGGEKDQSRFDENDYRIAAAALLVHAAVIDGHVTDSERNRLEATIRLRFDLDEAAAKDLIEAATEAEHEAVDLYSFTSLLNRVMDDTGRLQLVEMMWQVAYADGRVSEFEDNLIWRAADLLHVPARSRIELRQRVAEGQAHGKRHG
jgi:uncharacterized tellurite resistance protein B-like protein